MDNLAHGLAGALIARTLPAGWNGEPTSDPTLDPDAALTRPGRWLTPAAVVAANLPDVEALVLWPPPLGDKAAYLLHHRGWSHSLVGIACEALLFAGLLWITARAVSPERKLRPTSAASRTTRSDGRGRTAGACAPGSRGVFAGFTPARGLAVAALGAGSHLFLDWWNAYGVRPFYPFDKAWYYGDLVFVVDPWVWLMLAGGVLCGTRRFDRAKWLWYALAFAATAAVVEACRREIVPWWVLVAWLTGVAEVAALRWWGRWRGAAWVGWGMLGAYLLFAAGVTSQTRRATALADTKRATKDVLERYQALPAPGVSWERNVVRRAWKPDRMHGVSRLQYDAARVSVFDPWLTVVMRPSAFPGQGFPVADADAVAADFAHRPAAVKAWRSFARFPTVVTEWGLGHPDVVTLSDARYLIGGRGDWSGLVVPRPPQRNFWNVWKQIEPWTNGTWIE